MAETVATNQASMLTVEYLTGFAYEILGNRSSIRALLSDIGPYAGRGSTTAKVPFIGWGLDAMVQTDECVDAASTDLQKAHVTIQAERYALTRTVSDRLRHADALSLYNEAANWVRDAVIGFEQAVAGVTMALFSSFTKDNGNTTLPMTIAAFNAGINELELSEANGQAYAMLHPDQFAELKTDIESAGGLLSNDLAALGLLDFGEGSGFRGIYNGVAIFTDSRVTNDATDHIGLMWAGPAIGYLGPDPYVADRAQEGEMVIVAGPVSVEFKREPGNTACSVIASNAEFGVGILDDNRGVKLLSAV